MQWDAHKDIEENLEIIRRSNHSRFPFTKSGNLDEVEGVVLVKELMFQLRETPEEPRWEKHLQPLVVVPESMLLDQMLRKFQEERRHMAIVVDEYGGTTGIVTLEDVLEEIVGEIEDETDRIDRYVQQRPNGNLVVAGGAVREWDGQSWSPLGLGSVRALVNLPGGDLVDAGLALHDKTSSGPRPFFVSARCSWTSREFFTLEYRFRYSVSMMRSPLTVSPSLIVPRQTRASESLPPCAVCTVRMD